MSEFSAPILHSGDTLTAVSRWTSMNPAERHRRAAEAARDRDTETLWSLMESHMILYGGSGSRTSIHTMQAYRIGMELLIRSWSGISILNPRRDDAALWVRQLEAAGKSPSTVSVRLAGARALYRALRWTEATDADPFKDVRPARDMTPAWSRRTPYPAVDVERLIAAAGPEDRVLLLLASTAGLRVSECLGLHWSEVDLLARQLVVAHGKGDKRRVCPISRSLAQALDVLPCSGEHVISYRTTEQARRRVKALCVQVGIPNRAIHALRHSCGVRLYQLTGKLETVQDLLGHSDISTTQIYCHYADESVKNAVQDW